MIRGCSEEDSASTCGRPRVPASLCNGCEIGERLAGRDLARQTECRARTAQVRAQGAGEPSGWASGLGHGRVVLYGRRRWAVDDATLEVLVRNGSQLSADLQGNEGVEELPVPLAAVRPTGSRPGGSAGRRLPGRGRGASSPISRRALPLRRRPRSGRRTRAPDVGEPGDGGKVPRKPWIGRHEPSGWWIPEAANWHRNGA
jgi:hypothetical protein